MARLARWLVVLLPCLFVLQPASATAGQLIELPTPDIREKITFSADSANRWTEGVYDVWLLRGNFSLTQGLTVARSREAVLWIQRSNPQQNEPCKVIAYLEGEVDIECRDTRPGSTTPTGGLRDKTWLGRFFSLDMPEPRIATVGGEPNPKPPVYAAAMAKREPSPPGTIQRAQYAESDPRVPQVMAPAMPAGTRRVRAFARGGAVQAQWFPNRATNEWVAIINSGVNIVVDGLSNFGSIDLSADRVVIWTSGVREPDLGGESLQRENEPLEIYMEGNIEFRQGERLIKAQRMFYDVRRQMGVILGAEVLTPAPKYSGLLRLKAEVLRLVDRDRFVGDNVLVTTSRLGEPSYSFQTGQLVVEDFQTPQIDPRTGTPAIDPRTGAPAINHEQFATSSNNTIEVGGVPVFYWPTYATDLKRPTFYLNKLQVKNDSIFGTQILADLDAFQVFGIDRPPPGVDWDLSLDYLSERGPAVGTSIRYGDQDLFGVPGRYNGLFDAWYINDTGVDVLGADRMSLVPDTENRGRILFNHRQMLPDGWSLTAELGLISDRNFLEQYFENEFDQFKDQDTRLEFRRNVDNMSYAINVQARLNDFFMQTEELPRLDHFWIGESVLDDLFTYYEHTQVSYSRLRQADAPTDPADIAKFSLLPYERDVDGEVLISRHEIDLPFDLGPVKMVPYALGELARFGEAIDGDDLNRAYGQLGLRATLPMESVDPTVESGLFNLHGMAHKVVFSAQLEHSEATQDLEELALYNPLDDDAQEQFRRRFAFDTFGGPPPVPRSFDERFFALRSGLGSQVTSPTPEIADDLTALRLGVNQRWQTKRGAPENRHIVDWIVLDTNAVLFDASDNFGQNVGLADYDFRWHIGDRTTIVSSGFADFFPDGGKMFNIGGYITRPPRGSVYLGFQALDGPITSSVVTAAYTYRMSPKWVSTVAASVDFGPTGNIGQHVTVTRIGESFLATVGFNVDESKGAVGAMFTLEPRFLAKNKLARTSGLQIPPAGAFGVE